MLPFIPGEQLGVLNAKLLVRFESAILKLSQQASKGITLFKICRLTMQSSAESLHCITL